AQGVKITSPDHPQYAFTPLIEDIGTLPAKGSITVPVLVQDKSAAVMGLAGQKTQPGKKDSSSYPECSEAVFKTTSFYICGGPKWQEFRLRLLVGLCRLGIIEGRV